MTRAAQGRRRRHHPVDSAKRDANGVAPPQQATVSLAQQFHEKMGACTYHSIFDESVVPLSTKRNFLQIARSVSVSPRHILCTLHGVALDVGTFAYYYMVGLQHNRRQKRRKVTSATTTTAAAEKK